jgi:hypothetical protein
LCEWCKELHDSNQHTKYHDIVIYREKYEGIKNPPTCERHPGMYYKKHCLFCDETICSKCEGHKKHITVELTKAYKTYRQRYKPNILWLKISLLYYSCAFLKKVETDRQAANIQAIPFYQEVVLTKCQKLMEIKDIAIRDLGVKYKSYLLHRLSEEKSKLITQIRAIEEYEYEYEQSANMPIQFLLHIKKNPNPTNNFHINRMPRFSLPAEVNTSVLLNTTFMIRMKQRNIQELDEFTKENLVELKLKMMSRPVLDSSVNATGIGRGCHINCFTNGMIWVSDKYNLRLVDKKGDTVYHVRRLHSGPVFNGTGVHTVTRDKELVYIDSQFNINKLSRNMTEHIKLGKMQSPWRAHCIYSSPSSGDILIGLWWKSGKETLSCVGRLSCEGSAIQYIGMNMKLYRNPIYITENDNGDVVVSDAWLSAVVVTDKSGLHRFSYTGPTGKKFSPWGVCTDVFSHILVCNQNTVHMIDKDGQFLALLLSKEHGISRPRSLSYDHGSHLLWVGNRSNTLLAYRYITRGR